MAGGTRARADVGASGTGRLGPGATLGVFGGGQLGRMFGLAARNLGFRFAVFTDGGDDDPAAQVADAATVGDYADERACEAFARTVDAVTFEFENVPAIAGEAAARHVPVRPAGSLLHTVQDRLREKTALSDLGLPVARFHAIASRADLDVARTAIPGAGVLKTSSFGYDGKGQRRVRDASGLDAAWDDLGRVPCVLEELVLFECEVSVVVARGADGEVRAYEPFENAHANHILDVTMCPARIGEDVQREAARVACAVANGFELVGVVCVELFVLADGTVLVNEIAPRPHNSGHLTIDAHACSQFEQQARALAGLPLGSTERVGPPAAMANLLGDLWNEGEPNWAAALALPGVALHLYGKREARPGRKMGHLTVTAPTADEAEARARAARDALRH